ncbi:glucosamine-6-phosphate deaminase [Paenibacillus sambharensis]|uniref:Glucosamine-6-phosphate deaminase n=1 Tax=Paenibacillus sambharensis TaxID=1803190 RepID=A0A2W1LHT6_9BACL|nr:glucosamine-6-phosphate deaminase [Paenibacillus sambharensis]PZD94074.1 glucosamine-6-phosphate deaminase [Paenibacillus sambharensis]
MKIKRFTGKAALHTEAAKLITQLLKDKPDCTLGFATGSTPIGIYEQLVGMYAKGRLSFARARSFNLDEYVGLTESHPQSYRYYMQHHLFRHTDFDQRNTYIPNGIAADLEAECRRYDSLLAEHPIDLQLLGIGHNGHIGFNEPGHSLTGETHLVTLKPETRAANARFFDSEDEVPRQAITMGMGSILKAKSILLVVTGADKAAVVNEALAGPITTACPASLLQTHANVTVLLDADAGKELPDAGF